MWTEPKIGRGLQCDMLCLQRKSLEGLKQRRDMVELRVHGQVAILI